MSDIAVIGTGRLGARHLQALTRLPAEHRLWAVDPSPERTASARTIWTESALPTSPSVTWVSHLSELPSELAVAIVATSADVRRVLVEDLLGRCRVEHLVLEKVLFQSTGDYAPMLETITRATTTAWVNCPRRIWPFYRALRGSLAVPIRLSVTGSKWGIGSNTVHFLDLFAFLGGGDSIVVDGLHVEAVPSSREGFQELTGEVIGRGPGGAFAIASLPDGDLPIVVEVATPRLRALVREGEGKAWIADADSRWVWREEPVEIIFQSKASDGIVSDLLSTGTCQLTPLAQSVQHHLAFLRPLSTLLGEDRCPIT